MDTKNLGDGFEKYEMAGEIENRDLTTDDLIAIAKDQIQANQTIIDQIRRGEQDLENLMDTDTDGFMEWAILHKSDTVHHDDLCDFSQDAENWVEYGEWLEQFSSEERTF